VIPSAHVIGQTIGNFKVVSRLGVGGMGEVWLAEQQNIGTHVAIKLLNASVSQDTEHVQRFFNEARAVSRIQHAGIVKIFDVGTHAGQAYLIMEYLEGETLSQRLAKLGRLPFSQIGDIGRQIATVLDATHTAGITHRDLKPDNIFLVPDRELGERVKVLDFGIAKLTGTLAGHSPRTMGTMGTPAYMAPEQWGDTSKVDWRADLYSLGCVAFEMTCGRVPFVASTIAEACGKHINEQPPRASSLAPTVPASLERLIAQLLEKDPAARPGSMRQAADAFALVDKQALGTAPTVTTAPVSLPTTTAVRTKGPRVSMVLGVLTLAAGAAGAIYFLQRSPDRDAAAVSDDAVINETVATAEGSTTAAETTAAQPKSIDRAAAPPPVVDAAPPTPDAPRSPDAGSPRAVDAGSPPRAVDAGSRSPGSNASKSSDTTQPPGTADADALHQAVRARTAQTNRCYELALKDDPSLSGTVTLQIKIDANGKVIAASADGLTESLQACLIAQMREIKFPRPADAPVSIIFPFRFERE
jgi:hypothetical protein